MDEAYRDGGEWLYDVTWLEYEKSGRGELVDAPLVAECEWGDLGSPSRRHPRANRAHRADPWPGAAVLPSGRGLCSVKHREGNGPFTKLRHSALTHLGEDGVSAPLLMAKSRHRDLSKPDLTPLEKELGVCPTERKSTFFRQYLGFASMPDHNRLGVKFSVGQTPRTNSRLWVRTASVETQASSNRGRLPKGSLLPGPDCM